ncbi:MAG TPA: DUF2252 family protein [Kofleriaceae bacterium]|nr:DUF2252 family protein [Kofleriaceae bacterium]
MWRSWSLVLVTAAACGPLAEAPPAPPAGQPVGGGDGKADDPGDGPAPWDVRDGEARREVLIAELTRHNAGLAPADRAAKYAAMRETPFAFFRGSAHLFFFDLASEDRVGQSSFGADDAVTWVQGDAHADNFGALDDDGGTVVYDLTDFDDSLPASYLHDVWRLATSVALVADANQLDADEASDAVDALAGAYVDRIDEVRGPDNDEEHGAQLTAADAYGRLDEFLEDVERDGDRRAMLDDFTVEDGGERLFALDPAELAAVTEEERTALVAGIAAYRGGVAGPHRGDAGFFRVEDVARRLDQGIGSLGTARYFALVAGETADPDDDRILDIKREGTPSLVPFLPEDERLRFAEQFPEEEAGCRVAEAERALLAHAEDQIGCLSAMGESFSVRERSPFKDALDTDELDTGERLRKLAEQWAWLLAGAHARADRDFDPIYVDTSFDDSVWPLLDGRRGEFAGEVGGLALDYTAQVLADHALFVDALDDGSLE